MKVSIIVPVYRTNNIYLRNCIDSLLKQSLKDIEIILIDDGSPDDNGKICDEYAENHEKVRAIHQANQGVSVARNTGIDIVTGQYVMFVDADDVLKEHACEKAYYAAKQNGSDILIFRHSNILQESGSESVRQRTIQDIKKIQLSVINKLFLINESGYAFGSPWSKLFNREFMLTNNLKFKIGLKKAQDRVFMLHALEVCKHLTLLDYDGYFYNTHPGSICWNYNPNIISIADNMKDSFKDFIESCHLKDQDFINAYNYLVLNILFEIFHLDCFHKRNKQARKVRFKNAKYVTSQYEKTIKFVDITKFGINRCIILWLIERKMYNIAFLILDMNKNIRE